MTKRLLAAVLLLSLAGCAQYENRRGVLEDWQGQAASFVDGQTTRQQVMDVLGPPSQVIALGDETVLYYLHEHAEGEGFILVLYNQFKISTRYDRAIFFFDAEDRLTAHSLRVAEQTGG